ncbi:serine hydrolase [Microbacterium sp. ZXX196]|uniref:serine hydrolase domain-containing protein n=1 Tax=Microbacterium sp. ZXX196 TaxID=2609291 RepID=UPI0012B94479|nr:serine hydrolase domain-containing protein [Microbacterium sp. ZXX196]MTE24490.1 serine hydrolase [Microbacterium sp. ZXX196]
MVFRSRRLAASVGIVAVGALLLAGCTGDDAPNPADLADPLPDDVAAQLEAATERAMQGAGAPGAVAGVWVPWAGEWVEGVGETEIGSGETPSATMTFRAGEITRSMTCDVLFALDDRGTVSVDDPVTTYIPSTPQLAEVTLEDLCDGLSGVRPSQNGRWSSILSNLDRNWEPREFVAEGLGRGMASAESWRDSDSDYFLLGMALENASHTSLRELYRTYVAEPAGLTSTTLPGDAPGTVELTGYYTSSSQRKSACEGEPRDVTELSPTFGYANSGVVSTVTDLRDYASALAANVGSGDDVEPRWQDSLPTDPEGDQWVRAAGGNLMLGTLVGQQGAMVGYSTAAYSDVETGLTVVVVLNNSAAGDEIAGALARELAAIAMQVPGEGQPDTTFPWTVEQAHSAVGSAAVCPIEGD